jgi:hypothetical protein
MPLSQLDINKDEMKLKMGTKVQRRLVSRDNIYYFLFLNIIEKNSQF